MQIGTEFSYRLLLHHDFVGKPSASDRVTHAPAANLTEFIAAARSAKDNEPGRGIFRNRYEPPTPISDLININAPYLGTGSDRNRHCSMYFSIICIIVGC